MNRQKEKGMLIASMMIFGTIGLLRRHIPCGSGFVALVRAVIGGSFLLLALLIKKQRPNLSAIRRNRLFLIFSGAALGFNWIFLFEAYNHTSVATATLCYYLAPVLVILASPLVLKEKHTGRKLLCALIALMGMALVSGITDGDCASIPDLRGVSFGIAAAVLYASVIILNQKIREIDTYSKTIAQLFLAAAVLTPYVLLTEGIRQSALSLSTLILLLTAGILHTGVAYWLYFGSIGLLNAQTAALYSYLDPILAISLSLVLLREPMKPTAAIGSVLILGAAFFCDR